MFLPVAANGDLGYRCDGFPVTFPADNYKPPRHRGTRINHSSTTGHMTYVLHLSWSVEPSRDPELLVFFSLDPRPAGLSRGGVMQLYEQFCGTHKMVPLTPPRLPRGGRYMSTLSGHVVSPFLFPTRAVRCHQILDACTLHQWTFKFRWECSKTTG